MQQPDHAFLQDLAADNLDRALVAEKRLGFALEHGVRVGIRRRQEVNRALDLAHEMYRRAELWRGIARATYGDLTPESDEKYVLVRLPDGMPDTEAFRASREFQDAIASGRAVVVMSYPTAEEAEAWKRVIARMVELGKDHRFNGTTGPTCECSTAGMCQSCQSREGGR